MARNELYNLPYDEKDLLSESGDIPLIYYWKIIVYRKWLLLSIFTTIITATLVFSFLQTPYYQTTTTILLDSASPNPLEEDLSSYSQRYSSEYMNTEKNLVQTKNVAKKVITKLDLLKNNELFDQYRGSQKKGIFFFLLPPQEKSFESWLIEYLHEDLEVTPQRDSRILNITFQSADPQFAAEVVNAFAWAYDTYHLELNIFPLKKSVDWISKKVEDLKRDVAKKEESLELYKAEKGLVNANEQQSIAIQKLNQLNTQLVTTDALYYESLYKIKRIKELEEKKSGYESLSGIISNTLIRNLKSDEFKLEKQLAELSNRLGNKHPEYQKVATELVAITEKISEETDNVVASIKSEYGSVREKRDSLREALDQHKANILQFNRENFNFSTLTQETEATRKMYDTLLSKFRQTEMRGDVNRTNVIILDAASPPSTPTTPRIKLNVAVSCVVGVFLSLMSVFMAEYLDNSIKSERDLEVLLNLPVLETIPKG